jgi:hypothetical protein
VETAKALCAAVALKLIELRQEKIAV